MLGEIFYRGIKLCFTVDFDRVIVF